MKTIVLLLFGIVISLHAHAQDLNRDLNLKSAAASGNHRNFFTELPVKKGETLGSEYFRDEWMIGDLMTSDSTRLEDLSLKYNVSDNLLEIKVDEEIKVIPYEKVTAFYLNDPLKSKPVVFVSSEVLKEKKNVINGFYELVYDGPVDLLQKYKVEVVEASYNVAMDVGSKSDKLVQKSEFFVSTKSALEPLERNNSKFVAQLDKEKEEELLSFIKTHKLKLKKKEDLIKIFEYYQTI